MTVKDEHGQQWDLSKGELMTKAREKILNDRPRLVIGSGSHAEQCCELYKLQASLGSYFLHMDAERSATWRQPCIQELSVSAGVGAGTSSMCCFGAWHVDASGPGLDGRRLRFMSNASEVLRTICDECRGGHRHIKMRSETNAQTCPRELCIAVCKGLRRQCTEESKRRRRDLRTKKQGSRH